MFLAMVPCNINRIFERKVNTLSHNCSIPFENVFVAFFVVENFFCMFKISTFVNICMPNTSELLVIYGSVYRYRYAITYKLVH